MKERDRKIWKNWVQPYYMYLINSRWFREAKDLPQPHFVTVVKPALANVNESVVEELLSYRNWRHLSVGAWFAGMKGWSQYIEIISKCLGGNYSQMATCFALVCFNSDCSINYLSEYLERVISTTDVKNDYWNNHHFAWAIQALTYLDRQQGNYYFKKYHLTKKELFLDRSYELVYLRDEQLVFTRIIDFCDHYFWL